MDFRMQDQMQSDQRVAVEIVLKMLQTRYLHIWERHIQTFKLRLSKQSQEELKNAGNFMDIVNNKRFDTLKRIEIGQQLKLINPLGLPNLILGPNHSLRKQMIATFERIMLYFPQSIELNAAALKLVKEKKKKIEYLTKLTKLCPKEFSFSHELTELHLEKGSYTEARQSASAGIAGLLKAVSVDNQGVSKLFYLKGKAELKCNHFEPALLCFKESVQRWEKNFTVHKEIANVLLLIVEYHRLKEHLNRYRHLFADSNLFIVVEAVAQFRLKNRQKSEKLMEKLADLVLKKGKSQESFHLYDLHLCLNPSKTNFNSLCEELEKNKDSPLLKYWFGRHIHILARVAMSIKKKDRVKIDEFLLQTSQKEKTLNYTFKEWLLIFHLYNQAGQPQRVIQQFSIIKPLIGGQNDQILANFVLINSQELLGHREQVKQIFLRTIYCSQTNYCQNDFEKLRFYLRLTFKNAWFVEGKKYAKQMRQHIMKVQSKDKKAALRFKTDLLPGDGDAVSIDLGELIRF